MGGRTSRTLAAVGVRKRQPSGRGGGTSGVKKPGGKLEQLYLDFGQKSFGRQIHCARCKMMYTEGEPNDESAHRAHHERAVRGAVMRECDSEKVVRPATNWSLCRRATAHGQLLTTSRPRCAQVCRQPDGGRMVVIDASSSEPQQNRVREAASMMSVDLGDFALPTDYRAFLSIGPDARLRGCTVAHPITTAYCAELADGAPVVGARGGAGDATAGCGRGGGELCGGSLRRSEEPLPAACGVSHIWVSSEQRRRGVGSSLLEAVRCHMASSFELTRGQIAFCQPTDNGLALALSYLGDGRLLVYDNVEETQGEEVVGGGRAGSSSNCTGET